MNRTKLVKNEQLGVHIGTHLLISFNTIQASIYHIANLTHSKASEEVTLIRAVTLQTEVIFIFLSHVR
jgi:hypothetical protein